MKKNYTRKQITEAIKFWESQLNEFDENSGIEMIADAYVFCYVRTADDVFTIKKICELSGNTYRNYIAEKVADCFKHYGILGSSLYDIINSLNLTDIYDKKLDFKTNVRRFTNMPGLNEKISWVTKEDLDNEKIVFDLQDILKILEVKDPAKIIIRI